MERSTVSGNDTYGIRTRYDDITIQDSTIAGNVDFGLRISRSSAQVENSTISGNTAAGLGGFYGYFDLTSTVVSDAGAGPDLFNYGQFLVLGRLQPDREHRWEHDHRREQHHRR